MVRLRAFGTYTMRVTDPGKFLVEIVGTDGEFTTDEIEFQIRNHIVSNFSQIIASSGIPVLDMAANTIDLAKIVHERIAPMIAEYGLELPAFYIENISLPEEVEKVLDKRTSTSIAGDLSKYTDFSAAEAMTKSAANPGGGGGMAAGMGDGHGHGDGRPHGPPRPLGRGAGRRPAADAAAAARRGEALARGEGRPDHRPLHPRRARPHGRRGHDRPRHLALDPGRAGLAARPRRGRARRPLQRAAAPAAGRLSAWSSARSPARRARGAAPLPLPVLRRRTCATRPTSTG